MSIAISLLARALDLFYNILKPKCDTLRDLVPLSQFKKHEKHPWGNVAGFSLQLY